ncbi:hypothetical protein TGP89_310330 [Toxoplasma gondii p89]|uniref:Uncharacterized protein n=1 Tax=Toxoplasma gondii p89 TaxID=943119 RepID=A0A086K928_TOXGO|nr:hypothetical protein TGP89_310330 [Toxoplasma gondii p89]
MGASVRELMKKEKERREKERREKEREKERIQQAFAAARASPSLPTASSASSSSPSSSFSSSSSSSSLSSPSSSSVSAVAVVSSASSSSSSPLSQVKTEKRDKTDTTCDSRFASSRPNAETEETAVSPRRPAADTCNLLAGAYGEDEEEASSEEGREGDSVRGLEEGDAHPNARNEDADRSGLPADFFDASFGDTPEEKNAELESEEERQFETDRARETPRRSGISRLEDFVKEAEEEDVEVAFEIEEPSADLLVPLPKAVPTSSDPETNLASDDRTTLQEARGDTGMGEETPLRAAKAEQHNEGEEPAKSDMRSERETNEEDELASSVTAALLVSSVDEMHWYQPYATALHSEILHEETQLEDLREKVEAARRLRAAAREEAGEARPRGGGVKRQGERTGKDETELATEFLLAVEREMKQPGERGSRGDTAAKVPPKEKRSENKGENESENKAENKDELPAGFFDDEERDAEARGLVGSRKLKEMLARIAEKRREVADDLRLQKEDVLQQRHDIRRFFSELEEEEQKAAAYRMRVVKLKETRERVQEGQRTRGDRGEEHGDKVKSGETKKELDDSADEMEATETGVKTLQSDDHSRHPHVKRKREREEEDEEEEEEEDDEEEEEEDDEEDFAWRAKSLLKA